MGTTITPGSTKKSQIENLTRSWTHYDKQGNVIAESSCLRHCYRGNSFSGILWSVFEQKFVNGDKSKRWISCIVLKYYRESEGWGYKDMEESMHPYYYSCPPGYLQMVPIEEHGGCQEWRDGVVAHHERVQEKRRERRLAKQRKTIGIIGVY